MNSSSLPEKRNLRKFPSHDQIRYESKFTKEQRDEWFSQIWTLKGTRQTDDKLERRTAAYPEEIAERLIKMFSVKGDTVLDPFLGSGTTMSAAIHNQRNYYIANTKTLEFKYLMLYSMTSESLHYEQTKILHKTN